MNNKVKITTKESAIRAIMNEILFGASDVGGNELSTTIPADLPISPSNHVATQLSVQRPPIEDPEFIPSNQKELGRSLDALSVLVPDDKVQEIYKQLVSIIDNINSDNSSEVVA